MDNNTSFMPQSPAMTPQPAAPPVNSAPIPTPIKSGSPSKLVILAGVVVLLLAAAGVYWYLQNNQAEVPTPAVTTNTQPTVDSDIAGLKKELDSLVITEVEADFTAIDKDLNSL